MQLPTVSVCFRTLLVDVCISVNNSDIFDLQCVRMNVKALEWDRVRTTIKQIAVLSLMAVGLAPQTIHVSATVLAKMEEHVT